MKNILLSSLLLICGLVSAQQKKDSTIYEYKPRWYLNDIRDSVKVKEDIQKAIKKIKTKPKIKSYNRLCLLYKKTKATS